MSARHGPGLRPGPVARKKTTCHSLSPKAQGYTGRQVSWLPDPRTRLAPSPSAPPSKARPDRRTAERRDTDWSGRARLLPGYSGGNRGLAGLALLPLPYSPLTGHLPASNAVQLCVHTYSTIRWLAWQQHLAFSFANGTPDTAGTLSGHRSYPRLHSILLAASGSAPGTCPRVRNQADEVAPPARRGNWLMNGPWNSNEGHVPLSHAPLGSTCRVTSLLATGLSRRRLLDVGLVPGACVRPARRSPAGDPTAYDVKGTLIALRTREANQVMVEVFPPSEPAPVEKAAAYRARTSAWLRRCPWFRARTTRPAAP